MEVTTERYGNTTSGGWVSTYSLPAMNVVSAPDRGPIVKVDWVDIEQHDPCDCLPKDMPLCLCVSYGELVYRDATKLVLITERKGDKPTAQCFPIGCVRTVTNLEEKD